MADKWDNYADKWDQYAEAPATPTGPPPAPVNPAVRAQDRSNLGPAASQASRDALERAWAATDAARGVTAPRGFFGEIGEFGRTLKEFPRQVMEFATEHPFQSMWESAGEAAQRTKEDIRNRDYSSAFGHGLAGLLTGIGGAIPAQAGEEFGSGNPGAGLAYTGLSLAPYRRNASEVVSRGTEQVGRGARAVRESRPVQITKGAIEGGYRAVPTAKTAAPALTLGAFGSLFGPQYAAAGATVGGIPGIIAGMRSGASKARARLNFAPETIPITAVDQATLPQAAQGLGPVRPPLAPTVDPRTIRVTPWEQLAQQSDVTVLGTGRGTGPITPPLRSASGGVIENPLPTSGIPAVKAPGLPPLPPSPGRAPISPPLRTAGGRVVPVAPAEPPIPIVPAEAPPVTTGRAGTPIRPPIRSVTGEVIEEPLPTSGISSIENPVTATSPPSAGRSPLRAPIRSLTGEPITEAQPTYPGDIPVTPVVQSELPQAAPGLRFQPPFRPNPMSRQAWEAVNTVRATQGQPPLPEPVRFAEPTAASAAPPAETPAPAAAPGMPAPPAEPAAPRLSAAEEAAQQLRQEMASTSPARTVPGTDWRAEFKGNEKAAKLYLNKTWHALFKDMELEGSPSGSKAPSANEAARAVYGKDWMQLTADQMEGLIFKVMDEGRAPGAPMPTPPPPMTPPPATVAPAPAASPAAPQAAAAPLPEPVAGLPSLYWDIAAKQGTARATSLRAEHFREANRLLKKGRTPETVEDPGIKLALETLRERRMENRFQVSRKK